MKKEELIEKYPNVLIEIMLDLIKKCNNKPELLNEVWNEYLRENKSKSDFQVNCIKILHHEPLWLNKKGTHFCDLYDKDIIEYEKALLIGDIKSVVYKGIQYSINDVVDYNGKLYEIKSFDKEKVNLKERNGNYYYEPHISEISKIKPIGVSCDEFDIYLKDLVHWVDIKENYRYYYHSEMECFFFPQTAKIFKLKENALKFIENNNPKVLFTTFDGVEIFLGDLYYYLDEDLNDYFIEKAIETSGKDKEFKYFSSKESLENYKLKHAKVLSYDDIKIYLSTKVNDDDNLILDLVKERLNNK